MRATSKSECSFNSDTPENETNQLKFEHKMTPSRHTNTDGEFTYAAKTLNEQYYTSMLKINEEFNFVKQGSTPS